ncbi:MAG: hypothetical protein AAGB13_04020 [Cyanobacteria bacterium P01_F01_bin.33]
MPALTIAVLGLGGALFLTGLQIVQVRQKRHRLHRRFKRAKRCTY